MLAYEQWYLLNIGGTICKSNKNLLKINYRYHPPKIYPDIAEIGICWRKYLKNKLCHMFLRFPGLAFLFVDVVILVVRVLSSCSHFVCCWLFDSLTLTFACVLLNFETTTLYYFVLRFSFLISNYHYDILSNSECMFALWRIGCGSATTEIQDNVSV